MIPCAVREPGQGRCNQMATRKALIFVCDDQRDVVESLRLLFKGEELAAECFASPSGLLEALRSRTPDAVLLDLNYSREATSGEEGVSALAQIRAFDTLTPVIVMTAWGSIELAVQAMRRGAQDFIEKPWDNERLLSVLRTQVGLGRATRRVLALESASQQAGPAGAEWISSSPAMQPVAAAIERIAPTDANVLITGETGTGKGLLARMIHESSSRRERSLVNVNIGSLAETVFESELFGHVKGAFTDAKTDRAGRFELADGGTLFFDEIANISMAQQARLLRVLEDGQFEKLGSSRTQQVDVRVLSATNADIQEEIEAKRFRHDLLYRLNTIHIHLPPLRERGDDVILLAHRFVHKHASRHRKPGLAFDSGALALLRSYPWPGNIRELSHVIERAVLMSCGKPIGASDLNLTTIRRCVTLEEIEEGAIRAALARHSGNVVAAAAELGVSRSALYRRLEKLSP